MATSHQRYNTMYRSYLVDGLVRGQDFIQGTICGQKGMMGQCPSRRQYFLRRSAMLKLSFWIGMPSVITYLASTYSQLLENIFYIFLLSAAALVVAILSQISEKTRP